MLKVESTFLTVSKASHPSGLMVNWNRPSNVMTFLVKVYQVKLQSEQQAM